MVVRTVLPQTGAGALVSPPPRPSVRTNECADGQRVFGLEHVGVWRVVHNDRVTQVAAQKAQVLDVVALPGQAGFPE